MAAAAMKHMASSFVKLKKFKGVDFRIWQKKMHFMLSSMSVVYVLTTPMPKDGGENPTVEQVRKKAKWDNDDYVCRGLILNGMFDSLFDIYQNVETSKELWDTLEAKYMAEDASSKKFLVRNFTNYKMTDSRQVLEQYNELLGILGRFTQHKMNMDESIKVSCIIDKLPLLWKDFKHTLKRLKEELTLVELGSHRRIDESLRAQENDKPKGNNVAGLSVVNMVEHNNTSRYSDHKGKRKHHDTRANPNKKPKVTCWKCRKPRHLKKDCKSRNLGNRANGSSTKESKDGSSNPLKGQSMFNKSHQIYYVTYVSETFFVQDDDVAWWVDSRETMHVCKDRCWFKTYESLNDGSILHMGNESTALVHGRGCVDLRLGHVYFKRMQDMSKDGLIPAINMDTERCKTCMLTKITKKPFQNVKRETKGLKLIHNNLRDLHDTPSLGNKKYSVTFIDDAFRFCYVYLLYIKDEALDKFTVFKTKVKLQQKSLFKRFRTDRGGEYIDTLYFQSVGIIHETTAPLYSTTKWYILKEKQSAEKMVNSMLSYSRLSQGLWGEAMLIACYLLNRVPNKRNKITPYEPWTKKKPNLNYLRVWGCREADNPKTFDEAMKSQDVAFWKEAINDEMDSIVENNTWVLTDLPPGCRSLGCKWNYKRKLNVDGTVKKFKARWIRLRNFFSLRFSMKDIGEADVILGIRIKHENNVIAISQSHYIEKVLKKFNYSDCTPVSTPLDTCDKLMPNRGLAISQLEYSRVIGYLIYAMTCTRPDIAFAVGKLSMYTSNLGTQHWQAIQRVLKYLKKTIDYRLVYYGYPSVLKGYTDASWISNTRYNSSTSGWVFLLGGAIGKEAEWLKNLHLEILLWVKPMAPISICCDSATTLAKAYSKMYNGKSIHLGVRRSMIRELIMNEVVSIQFVRSQQNLVDHLMKGPSRDLVIKSAEGMGLKSN
nr:zinc finger, CCHC-type [Tanacetum cinerariifolium]GEX26782.1 zinc finger, CCHC-type [Tanacetum cinerariifolium]